MASQKEILGGDCLNQYGSRKASQLTHEKRILLKINEKGGITKDQLSSELGIPKKTVVEYLSKMKKTNKVQEIKIIVPYGKKISLQII